MLPSVVAGFISSLTLIVALAAQNVFVLQQGLRGDHVFWVCLLFACSDTALIVAGAFGLGSVLQAAPELEAILRFGGAAFLLGYGIKSLHQAWVGERSLHAEGARGPDSFVAVTVTSLALTWLNPHAYLDTVVLLGSLATDAPSTTFFVLGASAASFLFFFSLGFGARFIAPAFENPRTWQRSTPSMGRSRICGRSGCSLRRQVMQPRPRTELPRSIRISIVSS